MKKNKTFVDFEDVSVELTEANIRAMQKALKDFNESKQHVDNKHRVGKPQYYIAMKNEHGEYFHRAVPKEVYDYIHQLEGYIKNPCESNLFEVYADRFETNEWPISMDLMNRILHKHGGGSDFW